MKIALYIEDGREQIVLTPDTPTESGILGKMHDGTRIMGLYRGGFYRCQGGWDRESTALDSTIIVLTQKEPQP